MPVEQGVLLVVLILAVAFLFYMLGLREGLQEGYNKVAEMSNVLDRAGIVLLEEERKRAAEEGSNSWTGQDIPPEITRPPGTLRRWDEPRGH